MKPEGHGDDHEMVSMEFTCDHCQGLIIGRRMNCNVCDDFDLCYGCYAAKRYSYGYACDDLWPQSAFFVYSFAFFFFLSDKNLFTITDLKHTHK